MAVLKLKSGDLSVPAMPLGALAKAGRHFDAVGRLAAVPPGPQRGLEHLFSSGHEIASIAAVARGEDLAAVEAKISIFEDIGALWEGYVDMAEEAGMKLRGEALPAPKAGKDRPRLLKSKSAGSSPKSSPEPETTVSE
jgi:hypothetical protein